MTLLSAVAAVEETPVDHWLAAQADLSAVDRFSQRHDASAAHQQQRYYRDLLPATAPGPGQQYGFVVDLDTCTGCKACVSACHSLNGLDDAEAWRKVTKVTGLRRDGAFQQTITAACHHCVDPACLNGCPVDAYEKDPVTGIVKHLDDQCIGCSYCTLSCPYEVPQFNSRLGIVRKCDMCSDRLAEGEAPACVQACPNEAISITLVDVATIVAQTRNAVLVPGAPPSSITAPTTVYTSAKGSDRGQLAKTSDDGPAHAHVPLAVMLVLTQLSVGAFVVELVLRWLTDRSAAGVPGLDASVIAGVGLLALAASTLHLGRPRYAYRAVIGLRHSWLSREVVAFGGFMGLSVPYAATVWLGWVPLVRPLLGGAAAVMGVIGVACSVLIYSTTRRASWRARAVAAKFTASAAMTGTATVVWASMASATPNSTRPLMLGLAAISVAKLGGEGAGLRHLLRDGDPEGARRARLMTRDLRTITMIRFALGAVAGVIAPLLLALAWNGHSSWAFLGAATLMLAGTIAGELAERYLFFTTASRPR